jgi:excinuclease ABC subunit C
VNAALTLKLETLPPAPGVYLMKDRAGRIIYVGKAVNLRSRVRSYFSRASSDTRAFVALLDRLLGDLETIVVGSEKEALLLENELIKQHRPRFNVRLRDDKDFLCLRLDLAHRYPRLETVRRPKRDGARYFGPYASANSIRETLRVVNRFFQLRTCTDYALENRRRPCLLHEIGRCPAPCIRPVDPAEYRRNVEAVTLFLEGRSQPLAEDLHRRMKLAAARLDFEEAARLRDQRIALERSLERQSVVSTDVLDQDVYGLCREADRICIYLVHVRGGRISGGQAHHFVSEFPDDELLASFVNQYYGDDNLLPPVVLLPSEPGACAALEELLTERRGDRVRLMVPQRGDRAELVRLAVGNAQRSLAERKRTSEETEEVLRRLQERLLLRNLPRRMECFDVSHHQGRALVASQVVAVDGEPDRGGYRRYRLKTVVGNDDFASMREVLGRRLKRGAEEGDLPDLILIDGGKGQLSAVATVLKDLAIDGVDVVSLAKIRDLVVGDRDAASARSPERVFLVGRKDPVVLPQTSPELFVLTRLRDEAHRFAITFQRSVSRRQGLVSALDAVPGVGPVRRSALLRHFGSLKEVRAASIEALAEVPGLGPSVAERLHAFLHAPAHSPAQPWAGEADDQVRDVSLDDALPTPSQARGSS